MISLSVTIYGQDIHFTMFDLSPTTLNPGLIGGFLGSYRITGNFREQWPTIAKYTTPSIAIDVPLLKGFRKQDWVSFSFTTVQDKSGDVFQLKKTIGWLGASYHYVLSPNSSLGFGVQSGGTSFSQYGTARFGDPSGTDPAYHPSVKGTTNSGKKTYSDLNVGLVYQSTNSDGNGGINMGVALYHLTKPNRSFSNSPGPTTKDKQKVLLNAHAMVSIPLNESLSIIPGAVLHSISGSKEIAAQIKGDLLINKELGVAIQAGTGYRFGDAAFLLFGARIKDLTVGAAYDFNVSSASPSTSGIGGYELGVSYIGKIYKKPVIKPTIFCPRF